MVRTNAIFPAVVRDAGTALLVATPTGRIQYANAAAHALLGRHDLAALRAEGWQVPDAQGNFYWLEVGEATAALTGHLAAAGVLVRPFVGEGVRVSIGTAAENDRFLAAAASFRLDRGL